MMPDAKATELKCCQCGVPLPDQTQHGFEPVPEEMREKLLCNDCYQAEDGFADDED